MTRRAQELRTRKVTDPRQLPDRALADAHRRLHALLRHRLPPRARSLLTLEHELVRVAAAARWGAKHFRDNHSTPVDYDDLSARAAAALVVFERDTYCKQPNPRLYEALIRRFQ